MSISDTPSVSSGFSLNAADYDKAVGYNIHGAQRLVDALPRDAYDSVLDIGCGTGFASMAFVNRFGTTRITGVDPAEGMLDQFRAKLTEQPSLEVTLHQADVLEMPVPDDAFDAVICSMAFHWFPKKAEAAIAMARPLAPGGDLAILCSGRGAEDEFRRILTEIYPPVPQWVGAFDLVQRDIDEMERYLEGAGLDILDIWMERRIRRVPVEEYLGRMRVVASHLNKGYTDEELADLDAKVTAATIAASGPRGFEYTFTKLFAIARKPL
jgi:ubiquinone/menaquinone biosynthesis C-methylase UbiE